MTPEQQSALEGLLNRPLTADEITAITPLLDPNNRNDVAITDIINAGMPDVIGSLTVEEVFDSLYESGDYSTLKSAQLAGDPAANMAVNVFYDAKNIGRGVIDFSLQSTTSLFDSVQTAGSLSVAGRAGLLAKATTKTKTFHFNDISRVLNIAEGRMVL